MDIATSRRELAKQSRRQRLLDAAHDLLREIEVETVTVQAIAERAGVSAATAYNLFGAKTAILAGVYDQDLERFEARVAEADCADALDRIFVAMRIAADLYRGDPGFYRTMMTVGLGGRHGSFAAAVREPRARFWRGAVADAVAEGLLRPETDVETLGVMLVHIVGGGLGDWASEVIAVDRLEAESLFGIAALLNGFASDAARPGLAARLAAANSALSAARA